MASAATPNEVVLANMLVTQISPRFYAFAGALDGRGVKTGRGDQNCQSSPMLPVMPACERSSRTSVGEPSGAVASSKRRQHALLRSVRFATSAKNSSDVGPSANSRLAPKSSLRTLLSLTALRGPATATGSPA